MAKHRTEKHGMRSEILPTLVPTPDKWSYSATCRHEFSNPITSREFRGFFEGWDIRHGLPDRSEGILRLAQAVARRGMWIVDVLRPRAVSRGPGERHDRVTPTTIARKLREVRRCNAET
jgi:hypothetical protein